MSGTTGMDAYVVAFALGFVCALLARAAAARVAREREVRRFREGLDGELARITAEVRDDG